MNEVFVDESFCTVIIFSLLQWRELSEIKYNQVSINKSKPIKLLSLKCFMLLMAIFKFCARCEKFYCSIKKKTL